MQRLFIITCKRSVNWEGILSSLSKYSTVLSHGKCILKAEVFSVWGLYLPSVIYRTISTVFNHITVQIIILKYSFQFD